MAFYATGCPNCFGVRVCVQSSCGPLKDAPLFPLLPVVHYVSLSLSLSLSLSASRKSISGIYITHASGQRSWRHTAAKAHVVRDVWHGMGPTVDPDGDADKL